MMKLFTIVTICIILANPLFAKNDSGTNLLLLGDSAVSLGRAGTGVSSYGVDLFYKNPASIAASERVGLGLQYGTIDFSYYNPDISIAIPTSYGILGSSLRIMNIPSDQNDIKTGCMLSIGGSRDFTERLMAGASINLFFGSDPSDRLYYTGFSIGSIYEVDFHKSYNNGFGIFNPQIGFSINLGIPFGDNKDFADFNQVTLGYNFLFYRDNKIDASFFNEVSVIHGYEDLPLKFGFEAILNNTYIARAGFILPQSYEYGDFTSGLGYRFGMEEFDGDINYSLVHYSGWDFVHYLGLNIKFGKLDREPPETKIESSEKYVSPNYDGRQDFVFFNQNVDDRSRIKGWKLQILNSNDYLVREYRISERDIDEGLTLKGFIKKIWQKKESMVVPETILWDGTDSKRKNVRDGKYKYSFIAWDERDNISEAKAGMIYVDNTPPDVKAITDFVLFSPNGDNQKDIIKIKLDIKSSPEDEWNAGFKDLQGKTVKSFNWTGSNIPESVKWDGRENNGNDASEGLYNFFIESKDKAGNIGKARVRGISLTRKYEVADLTASVEYFSYKKNKEVRFFPYLSKMDGLMEWKVAVLDDDMNELKRIAGAAKLPKFVKWDGKDKEGERLDDGNYFFEISAKFKSGNIPRSFRKEMIVDNTPPDVSLSFSPDLFSPDEDGSNDILTIFPEARDKIGVNDWSLDIYAPSGAVFKTFKGKSQPAGEIKWDGIGKKNMLVESAADYYLQLSATDFAGNSSRTKRIKLPIDVLVVVTERGFKIMISNIEFAFNSARLKGRAFRILNRVAEILEKYGKYNVLIEGHTCDIGEEEYNLKLSEMRANSVMNYIISKGIDEDRLTFRGMGETTPFLSNTSEEKRRRNRRVEFLLIKKGMN